MKDANGINVPTTAPVPFVVTAAGYVALAARKASTQPACGECDFCVCVDDKEGE